MDVIAILLMEGEILVEAAIETPLLTIGASSAIDTPFLRLARPRRQ